MYALDDSKLNGKESPLRSEMRPTKVFYKKI